MNEIGIIKNRIKRISLEQLPPFVQGKLKTNRVPAQWQPAHAVRSHVWHCIQRENPTVPTPSAVTASSSRHPGFPGSSVGEPTGATPSFIWGNCGWAKKKKYFRQPRVPSVALSNSVRYEATVRSLPPCLTLSFTKQQYGLYHLV